VGKNPPSIESRVARIDAAVSVIGEQLARADGYLSQRTSVTWIDPDHTVLLANRAEEVEALVTDLSRNARDLAASPQDLKTTLGMLAQAVLSLKAQSPATLFRLRAIEIGLPILLSVVTVALLAGYPLTEKRCYEIKAELDRRKRASA
jgi:hypothetical protein